MSSDASTRRIARGAILLIFAIVPPVAALVTVEPVQTNPFAAVVALIVYESIVAVAAVLLGVMAELRKRWTARLAEATDAWIQRRISKYGKAYLRSVVASHSHIDLTGLTTRGEYVLELGQVFVELQLDPKALHQLSADPVKYSRTSRSSPDPRTIWYWTAKAHLDHVPLAIVGPPGSGKTTLLRHIASILAAGGQKARSVRAPRRMPIFIPLRDYKADFTERPPLLPLLIRRVLNEVPKKEPPNWIETQLKKGRLLVMLDGMDEVADSTARQAISAWADRQQAMYPETIFLLTSRPFGYSANPLATATVLQVRPFTETQINAFVRSWYQATTIRSFGSETDAAKVAAERGATNLLDRIATQPTLLELAANPLLLTMIANVHNYRGALPGSRAELYKEVCEVFLGKRHQARGVPSTMSVAQKQAVLQELAYSMMKERVRDLPVDKAVRSIQVALMRVAPDLDVVSFLRQVEESSGLLLERERDSYGFAHLTFQEYLAAMHVREKGLAEELASYVSDSWWRETILLFSAQADATAVIERCLEAGPQDVVTLALAAQCVEEAREVAPIVRQQLDARLDPPDVDTNVEARRAAGMVRLLRRPGSFERLFRDVYISSKPVTMLEYQCFLDDQWDGEDRTPDHWATSAYPAGRSADPVMGIRSEDAAAFCRWLKQALSDAWDYRLPFEPEVTDAAGRIFSPNQKPYAIWTNHSRSIGLSHAQDVMIRDDRLIIVLPPEVDRWSAEGSQRHIAVASKDFAPPDGLLLDQLRDDMREAVERQRSTTSGSDGEASSFVHEDIGLDMGSVLKLNYLREYMEEPAQVNGSPEAISELMRQWTMIRGLDVGELRARIENLGTRVFDIAYAADGETSAGQAARDLGGLLQVIQYASAISLTRSGNLPAAKESNREVRLVARLATLAAARACQVMGERTAEERAPADVERWWSRFIREAWLAVRTRIQPTISSPTDEGVRSLADEFLSIYVNLAILELRIHGTLPAWEGIKFVRSNSESDRYWSLTRSDLDELGVEGQAAIEWMTHRYTVGSNRIPFRRRGFVPWRSRRPRSVEVRLGM
jgi:hypothetical protein